MVESHAQILQAERRAWDYWFVDGLPSLLAGATSLIIALVLYFLAPPWKALHMASIVVLLLGVCLYIWMRLRMREIIAWMKTRSTYPRTGYVAPPDFTQDGPMPVDFTALSVQGADGKLLQDMDRNRQDAKLRWWVAVTLFLIPGLILFWVDNPFIAAGAGALLGMTVWLTTRWHARLWWFALSSFPLLAIYMSMFSALRFERIAYFMGGGGLALVTQGIVALAFYLRRNPLPSA
jgi:hypothetical protein